jgi:hypothetical protein
MDSDASGPDGSDEPDHRNGGLGTRGVVLVGVLLFAFLLAPGAIYWRPPQLPFLVAFLVLPLVPAIVLGLVAVWSLGGRDSPGESTE